MILKARESIVISRSDVISESFAGGDAGQITISAPILIATDNALIGAILDEGRAVDVDIDVETLILIDGARIDTSTDDVNSGQAGTINVRATREVIIASEGDEAGIFSRSEGSRPAGHIIVSTPRLEVATGGRISAVALGSGQNGTVTLEVDVVELTGGIIDGFRSGEVILDGSLGPRLSLEGPTFVIDADLGQTQGTNLFHSFERFRLLTGENAVFTGPDTIESIISRITGSEPSVIEGSIQSRIPGATLFLLSPSGFVFGEDASLDVLGAFYVSTADYLRLDDRTIFSNRLTGSETLTDSHPVALGFDHGIPSPISLQGSELAVPDSETFALIGGDINIFGDIFRNSPSISNTLEAPGGRIRLVSVSSSGEVRLQPYEGEARLQLDGLERLGTVTIDDAVIDVSSEQGGAITIQGKNVRVQRGSNLEVRTSGNADGERVGIALEATDTIEIEGVLRSETFGAGAGAAITLSAEVIDIQGAIQSEIFGSGTGGAVRITAAKKLTIGGLITNGSFDRGNGGRLVLSAPFIQIVNGQVGQNLFDQLADGPSPSGRPGDIIVEVETLTLQSGVIANDTVGFEPGGVITITATNTVVMTEESRIFGRVSQDSSGGMVMLTAPLLVMDGGGISTTTLGENSAGDIRIEVDRLKLENRAEMRSDTTSSGSGGTITVVSDAIELTDGATISAGTTDSGHGGNIFLRSETLELTDGATIAVETRGSGNGGDIDIVVGNVLLDGIRNGNSTGLVANTSVSGDGGTIRLESDSLSIARGASITAFNSGAGIGGQITIVAGIVTIDGGNASNFTGISAASIDVADLQTFVDIIHSFAPGLTITLVSPTGTEIVLADGAGLNHLPFDDFAGTVFDDRAKTPISEGHAPFAGPFRPQDPFSALVGENATGEWRLRVKDNNVVEQGILLDWSLRLGSTVFNSTDVPQTIPNEVDIEATVIVDTPGITVRAVPSLLGAPGDVNIRAHTLVQLLNGGMISTASSGQGPGGSITVEAPSIDMKGAVIQATTKGSDRGGNITLSAETVNLTERSAIMADSLGTGRAGTVTIQGLNGSLGTRAIILDSSSISVSTIEADGGNILVYSQGRVELRNQSALTTSVGNGQVSGGNITIDSKVGLLEHSEIRADAFGGPGGNITIQADGFIADANSVVSASSAQSIDGTVSIQGLADLSGSLTPIDPDFASTAALQSDPCIGRLQGEGISRFTLTGRDRLPTEPSGLLPSPSGRAAVVSVAPPARPQAAHLSQGHPHPASTLTAWHRDCVR